MSSTNRRRLTLVMAGSGVAHLGVLALLALERPEIVRPSPSPVFEVEVVPLFIPPRAERPSPRREQAERPVRPRRVLLPDETSPVAPLVTPNAPGRTSGVGTSLAPAPLPFGPSDTLRSTLRRSSVGCANADAVILDKAERDNCFETFGKGAKTAGFIPPPMDGEKERGFDEKVAAQEKMRIYRRTNIYPGLREALKAAR